MLQIGSPSSIVRLTILFLLFLPTVAHPDGQRSGNPSTEFPAIAGGWIGFDRLAQESPSRDSAVAAEADEDLRWSARIRSRFLSNFRQVSPDLYRGAQPDRRGMKELERIGIKTVINLRKLHTDRDEMEGTSLRSEHIPMTAMFPENAQVVRFLRIVAKKENGPFFVHCLHGSDRTGTMVAFYRIVFQGWTKKRAIAEMTEGGFGFHKIWSATLIPFIHNADIERLKEPAGVGDPSLDKR